MSLGGNSSQDTSVNDATASLLREQYADYLERFVPIENQLLDAISEPISGFEAPQPTDEQRTEYDTYRAEAISDRTTQIDEAGGGVGYDGGFNPEAASLRGQPSNIQGYDDWATGMGYPTEGGEASPRKLGNTALTNQFIGDAREIAGGQMDSAEGIMGRNASRYGMPMTGDRKTALDRGMNLGRSMMDVDVANKTRDQIDDFNVRTATELMNTGRGLSGDASSLYGASSSLEAARNATNQQLSASNDASTMAGLGTAAGLAMAFLP